MTESHTGLGYPRLTNCPLQLPPSFSTLVTSRLLQAARPFALVSQKGGRLTKGQSRC